MKTLVAFSFLFLVLGVVAQDTLYGNHYPEGVVVRDLEQKRGRYLSCWPVQDSSYNMMYAITNTQRVHYANGEINTINNYKERAGAYMHVNPYTALITYAGKTPNANPETIQRMLENASLSVHPITFVQQASMDSRTLLYEGTFMSYIGKEEYLVRFRCAFIPSGDSYIYLLHDFHAGYLTKHGTTSINYDWERKRYFRELEGFYRGVDWVQQDERFWPLIQATVETFAASLGTRFDHFRDISIELAYAESCVPAVERPAPDFKPDFERGARFYVDGVLTGASIYMSGTSPNFYAGIGFRFGSKFYKEKTGPYSAGINVQWLQVDFLSKPNGTGAFGFNVAPLNIGLSNSWRLGNRKSIELNINVGYKAMRSKKTIHYYSIGPQLKFTSSSFVVGFEYNYHPPVINKTDMNFSNHTVSLTFGIRSVKVVQQP